MFSDLLFGRGFRGGGYYDDWGPNRSGWADKSDAAIRRELQADEAFDTFLQNCQAQDVNATGIFPITEEVVKANVHLTSACWSSFRKRVEANGCKAKRREATPEERRASGDKRQGKLYVISITCPVHPSKAGEEKAKKAAAAEAKKKKAQEAAERKAEKERKDREERERLAALHRAKVRERYESIVGGGAEDQDNDDKTVDGGNKRKQSPASKGLGKVDSFLQVKVTSDALLSHAQTVHSKRQSDIREEIRKEEADLMSDLRKKHAQEMDELRQKMSDKQKSMLDVVSAEYDGIKAKIQEACVKETANSKGGEFMKENKSN